MFYGSYQEPLMPLCHAPVAGSSLGAGGAIPDGKPGRQLLGGRVPAPRGCVCVCASATVLVAEMDHQAGPLLRCPFPFVFSC